MKDAFVMVPHAEFNEATHIDAQQHAGNGSGIRIYPTRPERVGIQIRAVRAFGNGKVKRNLYAHAELDLVALQELRIRIDEAIRHLGGSQ